MWSNNPNADAVLGAVAYAYERLEDEKERIADLQRGITNLRQEAQEMEHVLDEHKKTINRLQRANEEHQKYAEAAGKLHDTNKARADYISNTAQHAIDKLRGADEKFDPVKGLLQNIKASAIELKEDDGQNIG